MWVIWILINVFFVYTGGQNSNGCVITPPSDWRGMYSGNRSTTVTGKTCKMWRDTYHPLFGTVNYCRAPKVDEVSKIGPWCYIDVEPWWEYCFIPTCDKHCVKSATDKNYKGTLNITISGYSCRMWNFRTPLPAGGGLPAFQDEDANYCRSPAGDVEIKPWCYTESTEIRWEYCAVPLCNDINTTICPDLIGSALFSEPSILTGHRYNTVVTFKCKAGYRIQGSSSLKCLANPHASIYGHWNTTQPTCIRVPCPPTSVLHSDAYSVNSKRFPDIVTVTCDNGYKLYGNNILQCLNTGQWSTAPTCIGVQCPSISLTNSDVQNMGIKRYPDTIQVTCNNGYNINGSSTIRCTATGQWNTISSCVGVQCPFIYITNSNVHNMNLKRFPDSIHVTCNSGYQINGSSVIHCAETGQWSTIPTCVGVLCLPISITNSNVQNIGQKRFPDSIKVTCNSGYQIDGSSTIHCTESGQWNTIPTCVGMPCPDLVPRAHLTFPNRLSNYTYNDTVRFVCDTGYYVLGDNTIVCSRQGLWNGSIPTCEPVPCPILNIANATKQTVNRRYYYRDRVTIACYKGFALKGNANLACLANGEWSSTLPVCQKIACNATRVLPNVLATRSETMVDVNDNVTFFCRPGFSGQTVISTCSFDLTWIPKPPICKSKSVVMSIGLSYTVFGLVDAGIITCSVVVILGVVIYFRRRLKAAESHYESIQMHKDFKPSGNTEDVYSELT